MLEGMTRRGFVAGATVVGAAALCGGRGMLALANGAEGASFKPGSYTATRQGAHSDITVSVAVGEDGSVESVEVVENDDTGYISAYAVDLVSREIVENQTTDVNVASGATMSSLAIIGCVEDCLEQAGAPALVGEQPAPQRLEGQDAFCDVLVVGGGTAGILAACAAATEGKAGTDSGLSVMLVEQLPFLGGSFIVSGAGIFSIYGDPQHESGEFDTIQEDDFVRYMTERSQNDPLGCLNNGLQHACYQAMFPSQTLMIDLGAPFSNSKMDIVDAMAIKGEGYSDNAFANLKFLDDDGNVIPEYAKPIADTVGKGFVKIVDKLPNVEVRCGVEATGFVVEDGAVTGVDVVERDQVANTEKSYRIMARKVVVAPGSPNLNPSFLKEHGFDLFDAFTFCEAGSTGKVPEMLQDAGVDIDVIGNGGMCYNATGPEYAMEDGLALGGNCGCPIVNFDGKRYYDESGTAPFDTGRPTVQQRDNSAFIIADSSDTSYLMTTEPMFSYSYEGMTAGDYAVKRGWAEKADTLEELADKVGVPVDALSQTVRAFNAAAAGEREDEMGSDSSLMHPVLEAPFFAVKIHACRTEPYIGLRTVPGSTQIATSNGGTVGNLYGAGTLIGPNLFYVNYFQFCGGLTTALATGYLAGCEARESLGA